MSAGLPSEARFDDLAEDYLAALRAGEPGDPERWAGAHPDLADRIRRLFPVLALVEGLKPRAAPAAAPGDRSDAVPPGAPPATAAPVAGAPAAGAPAAGAPEPRQIGPWTLLREVGRGGMGRVYEARGEHGARAAVKLVHPHLLAQASYVERFLREAEAGARIDHPGVVRTLQAGCLHEGGLPLPYLVLEYVEGQTLRQLLHEVGPLSERLCRTLGARVADALAAVHAAGLVHRDVKPENVVITPAETVRLMDLGVALLQDEARRITRSGQFVGSLLYAAPEQLRGDPVDARADLHGLGLLLYELAAGRHPDLLDVGPAAPGDEGRRPPLATVAPVSPFFSDLVQVLLRRDPAGRFPHATEVAALLREGEASAWWRAREGARGRPAPRRHDRPTALFGREAEMALLEASLAAARAGAGRVLLLEGEAGIGKSRLIHEILDRLEGHGAPEERVAIAEHTQGQVLEVAPLSAALRDLLGPGGLEGRLATLLDESARLAGPFARHLRGEAGGAASDLPEAALGTAHRLLLRGLAREGPLVLVAEDLHLASEGSRALFLALAGAVAAEPVLLVGTTRPGLPEPWREAFERLPHAARLDVPRLDPSACHDLLRAALGRRTATSALADVVQQADGNPFCLIEIARALRARPDGAPSAPLPDTLRRLVAERLRALLAEETHLLAVAACAGERFDPVAVCDAAETRRIAGLRTFMALDRTHGLVQAEGSAYRFRHHLILEVLREDLPPALRAEIHHALARSLESAAQATGVTTDGARAYAIAHHHLLGREPRRALPHVAQALEHATGLHAFRRAARMAEQVLALEGLDPRLEARVALALGVSRITFLPAREAVEPLQRALARARELGDEALIADAGLHLGVALRHAGRPHDALAAQGEASACAARLGDGRLEAGVLGGMAATLGALGRLPEAREVARRALALAREAGAADVEAEAAFHLGANHLERGDLGEARRLLGHAVREAHALGDRLLEASAVTSMSKVDYLEARMDEVWAHLDRLVAIGREVGHLRAELVARVNLSQACLTCGRFEEGLAHAREALTLGRRAGYGDVHAHGAMAVGLLESALGRWEAAREAYAEGRQVARRMAAPVIEARIASREAILLARAGRFDEAEAAMEGWQEIATTAGAPREAMLFDEARAVLLEARGEDAAAADVYERLTREAEVARLWQEGARFALALGVLRARLDQPEEARPLLEKVVGVAGRAGMRDLELLARIHASCLPGSAPTVGRVLLGEHADALPVHERMRARAALARATGEPTLLEEACADLDALVRAAPACWRPSLLASRAGWSEAPPPPIPSGEGP